MIAHQVGVAAALAVAVDRALDLTGAGVDRGQRVGHRQFAVVVGVDAHGDRQRRGDRARTTSATNAGSDAAVGVAEHDDAAPASAAAVAHRSA